LSLSLPEIQQKEVQAFKQYYEVKKKDKLLRRTFLEEKADNIAQDKDLESGNVYKQLIRVENQRTAARNIRYTLQKLRGGGITKVDVIKNGQLVSITTKEGIERECMKENDEKFRQTKTTPCMQEPLKSLLGRFGTTPFCDEILEGTATMPLQCNQYTRELLREMKKVANYHSVSNTVSTEDFQQGWKKMKEQTSAGISGLHFGHLKTCTYNKSLSDFEASLASLPFTTGFSPTKWQYGITVMIHKKNNDDLITGLRTLVLTEADLISIINYWERTR
jgi:hypothetical protein